MPSSHYRNWKLILLTQNVKGEKWILRFYQFFESLIHPETHVVSVKSMSTRTNCHTFFGIFVPPEQIGLLNSFTVMRKILFNLHALLGLSRHTFTAVATATLIYKALPLPNFLLTANYRQLCETAEVLMDVTAKITLFRNVTACCLTYGLCAQNKKWLLRMRKVAGCLTSCYSPSWNHSQGALAHHPLLEMLDVFSLRAE